MPVLFLGPSHLLLLLHRLHLKQTLQRLGLGLLAQSLPRGLRVDVSSTAQRPRQSCDLRLKGDALELLGLSLRFDSLNLWQDGGEAGM